MKKFTKIIAAATAAILTLGIAGCNKDSGSTPVAYPSFINSENSGETPTSEKYVVNVLSEGGTKLDGVKIAAKRNGATIKNGISKGGKIEFNIALGDYELVIDETSLPKGYYAVDGATYRTNPSKREEITVRLPSKPYPASENADSYAVGNIMRDFTFTDSQGADHTLSKLLETKKAVVLNFWYTTCSWCIKEFPFLQKAYESRTTDDIEVLGICTTSMGDTAQSVVNFKTQNNLTFPMGMDRLGLCSAFNVKGYPCTVVIDRYGMIAYRHDSAEITEKYWTNLFNKFAAADYVQDVKTSGEDDGGNNTGTLEKPNVQMPSSVILEQAALDERVTATFKADEDEYSWPWLAGEDADGSYIYSSNKGKDNSYAIVYADIKMKKDQVLSFDYEVSSESADALYVMLDGAQMNTGWAGEDKGHINLYVADRDKTVELAFTFLKDPRDGDNVGEDVAKIRNISLSDSSAIVEPLDVMRSCASGEVTDFKYASYVKTVYSDPADGGDGFYHKDTADGPIIYMTLNQLTPWTDLRGNSSLGEDGTPYANTIYKITEQKYLIRTPDESGNANILTAEIGGVDITEAYSIYVLIMGYMPAPFYLLPVTPLLKDWADALSKDYDKKNWHEDEWLEFCYYYDHYGAEHNDAEHGDRQTCKVDVDYTRGLTKYNAYTAYEKDDPALASSETYNGETGRNKAIIDYPLQLAHNGTYYKFKADKAGVYQIRSYTEGCSPEANRTDDNVNSYVNASPAITVYDNTDNILLLTDGVFDHDEFKGEIYEGFNDYITLDAGEEVYLYLETTSATKSYYDFEITYRGETYNKMLICSTAGGLWTWIDKEDGSPLYTYLGVDVRYDEATDCYYATKNGEIAFEQPVYIDMLYSSFFTCDIDKYCYKPLKTIIEDYGFEEHLYHGEDYQPIMEEYLGKSTEGKQESDELYGLVPANREIVDLLNMFINQNVDGGKGEGNGWLAFAVYNAKMGK